MWNIEFDKLETMYPELCLSLSLLESSSLFSRIKTLQKLIFPTIHSTTRLLQSTIHILRTQLTAQQIRNKTESLSSE